MPNDSSASQRSHAVLLDLFAALSSFGETEKGGVSRLAASAEDGQARDYLCDWLQHNDYTVLIDQVGNIFGILDLGQGEATRHFFCGSHLDSQPDGGKFDGTLGVACACVAGLEMRDAVAKGQLCPTFQYFVVACWTGEEGARFQPSLIGSSTFAGLMPLQTALNRKDRDGISLKTALSKIGYLGNVTAPQPDHYLEIHIEQGPILEKAAMPMGVVSSCWGAKKILVRANGRPDHTGPTPMEERRDALLAASHLVVQVHEISRQSSATLYSSVGRIEVSPNSPNTIAEKAQLWIEFRSNDAAALVGAERKLSALLGTIGASTNCDLEILSTETRDVIEFDKLSNGIVQEALSNAGIPSMNMSTIAGHDAIRLQSVCPSTLLFVPSRDGISHSPEEFTSDRDICAGFDGMVHALSSLLTVPIGADVRESA